MHSIPAALLACLDSSAPPRTHTKAGVCPLGGGGYSTALGCGAGRHKPHQAVAGNTALSCGNRKTRITVVLYVLLLQRRRMEPSRASPGPVTSPLALWVGPNRPPPAPKPLAASSRAQAAASGAPQKQQQSLKVLNLTALSLGGQKHTLGLKMWTHVQLSWRLLGRQATAVNRPVRVAGLQLQPAATAPSSSRCRQQPQQQSQQHCQQQCQQGLLLHIMCGQGGPQGLVQRHAGCSKSGASVPRAPAALLTTQAATQVSKRHC